MKKINKQYTYLLLIFIAFPNLLISQIYNTNIIGGIGNDTITFDTDTLTKENVVVIFSDLDGIFTFKFDNLPASQYNHIVRNGIDENDPYAQSCGIFYSNPHSINNTNYSETFTDNGEPYCNSFGDRIGGGLGSNWYPSRYNLVINESSNSTLCQHDADRFDQRVLGFRWNLAGFYPYSDFSDKAGITFGRWLSTVNETYVENLIIRFEGFSSTLYQTTFSDLLNSGKIRFDTRNHIWKFDLSDYVNIPNLSLAHSYKSPTDDTETLLKESTIFSNPDDEVNFEVCADGTTTSIFSFFINSDTEFDIKDLNLYLRLKKDPNNNLTDFYGIFKKIEEESNTEKTTFSYTHPSHLAWSSDNLLTVEIINTVTQQVLSEFKTKIHPTPVLMVHGLVSNKLNLAQTWQEIIGEETTNQSKLLTL